MVEALGLWPLLASKEFALQTTRFARRLPTSQPTPPNQKDHSGGARLRADRRHHKLRFGEWASCYRLAFDPCGIMPINAQGHLVAQISCMLGFSVRITISTLSVHAVFFFRFAPSLAPEVNRPALVAGLRYGIACENASFGGGRGLLCRFRWKAVCGASAW